MVCSLKTWGHYLGTYKTKVFTDNVFLQYFETQLNKIAKMARYFGIVRCGVKPQIRQGQCGPKCMCRKEEFQVEKTSTKTHALKGIF